MSDHAGHAFFSPGAQGIRPGMPARDACLPMEIDPQPDEATRWAHSGEPLGPKGLAFAGLNALSGRRARQGATIEIGGRVRCWIWNRADAIDRHFWSARR